VFEEIFPVVGKDRIQRFDAAAESHGLPGAWAGSEGNEDEGKGDKVQYS
jgi:hypothetical protein